MKILKYLLLVLCCAALRVNAANPSYNNFNTTQFGAPNGGMIIIKNGSLQTNNVFWSAMRLQGFPSANIPATTNTFLVISNGYVVFTDFSTANVVKSNSGIFIRSLNGNGTNTDLYDIFGIRVLDSDTRVFFDNANHPSINFNERRLYKDSVLADTVLDWQDNINISTNVNVNPGFAYYGNGIGLTNTPFSTNAVTGGYYFGGTPAAPEILIMPDGNAFFAGTLFPQNITASTNITSTWGDITANNGQFNGNGAGLSNVTATAIGPIIGRTYFVTTNGNDHTAQVDNLGKSWGTIDGAVSNAVLQAGSAVVVYPGVYLQPYTNLLAAAKIINISNNISLWAFSPLNTVIHRTNGNIRITGSGSISGFTLICSNSFSATPILIDTTSAPINNVAIKDMIIYGYEDDIFSSGANNATNVVVNNVDSYSSFDCLNLGAGASATGSHYVFKGCNMYANNDYLPGVGGIVRGAFVNKGTVSFENCFLESINGGAVSYPLEMADGDVSLNGCSLLSQNSGTIAKVRRTGGVLRVNGTPIGSDEISATGGSAVWASTTASNVTFSGTVSLLDGNAARNIVVAVTNGVTEMHSWNPADGDKIRAYFGQTETRISYRDETFLIQGRDNGDVTIQNYLGNALFLADTNGNLTLSIYQEGFGPTDKIILRNEQTEIPTHTIVQEHANQTVLSVVGRTNMIADASAYTDLWRYPTNGISQIQVACNVGTEFKDLLGYSRGFFIHRWSINSAGDLNSDGVDFNGSNDTGIGVGAEPSPEIIVDNTDYLFRVKSVSDLSLLTLTKTNVFYRLDILIMR